MPDFTNIFYAVEKFPPPTDLCTQNKNFIIGDLIETNMKFDAGTVIEVIEHLPPKILKNLVAEMSATSNVDLAIKKDQLSGYPMLLRLEKTP